VPIRTREPIARPDVLVIQDPTLLHQVDVFSGLAADGRVLINSAKDADALGLADVAERIGRERLLSVPATDIARAHLGRPLPNAVLLGALAAFVGVPSLDALAAAILRRFPGSIGDRNVAGAAAAHAYVLETMEVAGSA
jgi:pyruvate ferredoxin oxidoreductase gamma subunit